MPSAATGYALEGCVSSLVYLNVRCEIAVVLGGGVVVVVVLVVVIVVIVIVVVIEHTPYQCQVRNSSGIVVL